MRTRFDVVLPGEDNGSLTAEAAQAQTARLRAISAEALAEVEAAEKRFNFFDPESWLSRVNQRATHAPVQVPADVFALLSLCRELFVATDGAFDPAVGGLDQIKGGVAGQPNPTPSTLTSRPSFADVEFDRANRRIQFHHPQLQLDLGGVAKGWAIDLAAEVLLDEDVTCALIQGGSSSMRAIGSPPGQQGWKVEIGSTASTWLHNQALAVSHSFADDGSTEPPTCHIINPANGAALRHPALAAVLGTSAAETDAWSTALLLQDSQPFLWKQLP